MLPQSGSIFTPGTSIQGELLHHALLATQAPRVFPVLPEVVMQCGTPAVLVNGGGLDVFVAGQVNSRNSPFFAPWPLSPLYLHTESLAGQWELLRLPNALHGRPFFVSGVPSALSNGDDLIVYFNGGQLMEYTFSPGKWWQVQAVPSPDIVVEANPVAAIVAGRIFVFSIPNAEYLLLSWRSLASADWQFIDLTHATANFCREFDGDPAVSFFAGHLHVFVSASSHDIHSSHPSALELWDFVVDPITLTMRASAILPNLGISIVGTTSVVAGKDRIRVFARSADENLFEFSSVDGEAWTVTNVSAATEKIGSDPGVLLLGDGSPLVCAADRSGSLLQFTRDDFLGHWQVTRIFTGLNSVQRRPLPVLSTEGISVFDLKVPL